MKSEVKMSPNNDNPEEVKKAQKKYLWFGYGSYTTYGFSDPVNTNNLRAAPDILDKLFELFGVKEKEPEEKKNY